MKEQLKQLIEEYSKAMEQYHFEDGRGYAPSPKAQDDLADMKWKILQMIEAM